MPIRSASPATEDWRAEGEFIHAAYTPREDDEDWGQPGTMAREEYALTGCDAGPGG